MIGSATVRELNELTVSGYSARGATRGKLLFVRTALLCFLVCFGLTLRNSAQADTAPSVEYPIKAAFLYKFALYVQWPAIAFKRDDSPIAIGVLGTPDVVEQVRAAVRDRQLAGRPITVTQVNDQPLSGFHILFIARSEQSRPDQQAVPVDLPILVITESSDWPRFSVINFVLEDKRIRFDVNLESAQQRGLNLSAQLLNVARRVRGMP